MQLLPRVMQRQLPPIHCLSLLLLHANIRVGHNGLRVSDSRQRISMSICSKNFSWGTYHQQQPYLQRPFAIKDQPLDFSHCSCALCARVEKKIKRLGSKDGVGKRRPFSAGYLDSSLVTESHLYVVSRTGGSFVSEIKIII